MFHTGTPPRNGVPELADDSDNGYIDGMAREEITIGGCPQCGSDQLICKYNRFESDDLRIDSWEHRCPDCGQRETQAMRSDDEDPLPLDQRLLCPYCARRTSA